MRRLREDPDSERGVTAVIVAIMLVVLVGFAALAVDVGAVVWDRKQLQNGADAGALAIAQACAQGACGNTAGDADDFAKANKSDPLATSTQGSVLGLTASAVTVQTSATRQHWFAPVLAPPDDPHANDSSKIFARATAEWGSPRKAKAIPFATASCWFMYQTGSTTSAPPPTGTTFSIPLMSKTSQPDGSLTCGTRAAHADTAGGFGWLAPKPVGSCSVTIDLSDPWVGVSTGQPAPCALGDDLVIGDTLLMPLYDQWRYSGSNAEYRIFAFAAFKLTGYCFNHGVSLPVGWPTCKDMVENPQDKGQNIRGTFVRYVSLDEVLEFGGPDLGATGVRLTLNHLGG